MEDDLVVSEVNHLLSWSVSQTDDSLQSLRLQLLRVDGREHFLQPSTDHPHLSVLAEPIQHNQWVSEGWAEWLSSSVQDISHPAVVNNTEGHLSSTDFDEPNVIPVLIVLQCH